MRVPSARSRLRSRPKIRTRRLVEIDDGHTQYEVAQSLFVILRISRSDESFVEFGERYDTQSYVI